jgi:hypothetical protein
MEKAIKQHFCVVLLLFYKNLIDHIVERPYNKITPKPDSNEFQTWGGILCKFKRYGKKGTSIKNSYY